MVVRSAAPDRAAYLRRPDLGRRLDAESRAALVGEAREDGWDAVFVIADVLSAAGVQQSAVPLLAACRAVAGVVAGTQMNADIPGRTQGLG